MALKVRHAALKLAPKYVGVTEHPTGSNRGPRIDIWNMDACGLVGVYWCASFIHGLFKEAGFFLWGGASVGNIVNGARERGCIVKRPRKGDLACFGSGAHIGIVVKVLALRWSGGTFTGWIQTIEGNTSLQGDPFGSQSNGGGVFVRRRWVSKWPATFVRVQG